MLSVGEIRPSFSETYGRIRIKYDDTAQEQLIHPSPTDLEDEIGYFVIPYIQVMDSRTSNIFTHSEKDCWYMVRLVLNSSAELFQLLCTNCLKAPTFQVHFTANLVKPFFDFSSGCLKAYFTYPDNAFLDVSCRCLTKRVNPSTVCRLPSSSMLFAYTISDNQHLNQDEVADHPMCDRQVFDSIELSETDLKNLNGLDYPLLPVSSPVWRYDCELGFISYKPKMEKNHEQEPEEAFDPAETSRTKRVLLRGGGEETTPADITAISAVTAAEASTYINPTPEDVDDFEDDDDLEDPLGPDDEDEDTDEDELGDLDFNPASS